jgi:hypothetical protein
LTAIFAGTAIVAGVLAALSFAVSPIRPATRPGEAVAGVASSAP